MFSRNNKIIFFTALILTIFILVPMAEPVLSYEHDTFFHLSRIEGLANAIRNLDFLPKIYPYKNAYFGYASPIFYSDFFLFIPSLIYLLTDSVVISYKIMIFILTFITAVFMGKTCEKFCKNIYVIILAMTLYTFATYHIANIYVRSAVGELFGYALLPLVILAIYRILYEDDKSYLLTIVISALILSHNLSFVIACIMLVAILVLNFNKITLKVIRELSFAVIWVILLTAFFTFPMLEQLNSLDLFVEYVNEELFITSTLKSYQFLMTRTNFYIFNNSFDSMVVNTGLLLMLLPLSKIFILDKDKTDEEKFISRLTIAGYIFLLIQSAVINYEYFPLFYPLQFVWRFMLVSCVCLSIPAAYYSLTLFKKYQRVAFVLIMITSVAITTFLLSPVFSRTNIINNDTQYSELIDGSIIDPYYSAWYVRVEVAGGDYLHSGGIDYQNYPYQITDEYGVVITDDINLSYNKMIFSLDQPDSRIILPKSYYKGYQVYHENEKLPTYIDTNTKLVAFDTGSTSGEYVLKYDKTIIQYISTFISILTMLSLIYIIKKNSAKQ